MSDLEEWAAGEDRSLGAYHRCHTCRHAEAAAVTDELIAAVERVADRRGRNGISLTSVYKKLVELVPNYGMSQTALVTHIKRCRPETYDKLWRK